MHRRALVRRRSCSDERATNGSGYGGRFVVGQDAVLTIGNDFRKSPNSTGHNGNAVRHGEQGRRSETFRLCDVHQQRSRRKIRWKVIRKVQFDTRKTGAFTGEIGSLHRIQASPAR